MIRLSAPTWGVEGPQFLASYASALLVFLAVAIALRRWATRADTEPAGRLPTAAEAALILGGRAQAVFAAVAALKAGGAVGNAGRGVLGVTGSLPSDASRLDTAVYDAIRQGTSVSRLPGDPSLVTALDEVEASATRAGWLLPAQRRSAVRTGGFVLAALAAFGAVRTVAGFLNQQPSLFILLLTILTAVLAVVFLVKVPRVSRAGLAAVQQLRSRNTHLHPRHRPSWSVYGATGAALSVALWGLSAWWVADAAFAAAAGLPRAGSTRDYGGTLVSDPGNCSGGSDGGGCSGGGCGG